MAQNVTIAGNQYPSVPSVLIPKTGGGGNAVFADPSPVTASAADVLAGKYFLDSTGSITEGTGSGGGGGDNSADEIIGRTISGTYTNTTASLVGSYAFAYCNSLTSVSFPSVTKISTSAFTFCNGLTSASFPSVTIIGSFAFYSCTKLTGVYFPLATTISNAAFSFCALLASASFSLVTTIGSSAFYSCSGLTEVNIPLATAISAYALANCRNLTSVSFSLVTTIGSYAFRNCTSLESAYFLGSSLPTLGSNAFSSTPMSASSWIGRWGSIFVKASLLDTFKTATNWSTWKDRIVGLTDAQIEALG